MKKPKYDKKIIERRDKINKRKLFTMIPIEISNDKSLKTNERLLMGEIVTMQHFAGEFRATNQYIGDILNVSSSRASAIVNDLRKRGYLHSYQHYDPVEKRTTKRTLHANVFKDCKCFKVKLDESKFEE
ncbi:hypothetical protein N9L78_00815 [Gammaproteobacteria bacterium]|jgi:DNA-binding MarR family transcriptional regulator|nr:hypothetical protein [Gammaproteobacteria bacterium]